MTFPVFPGSNPSGYNLTRSLRFRASASAYLNRTFTSTGNRQIWTWSGWVKRGALSSGALFGADGSNYMFMYFSPDSLDCGEVVGSQQWRRITTQVFRDPSAWYHIVLAFDSTQATAGNRVKLYVNGSQVTAFSTSADPSLNYNSVVNTTIAHSISSFAAPTRQAYFDGYMTEINFIDGQALTPSSFGSTNTLTGVWQPAQYTGTYGTNGFELQFTDNSGATATTIGKDFSGNGNNWTPNNISVTAGVTYDSMTDVPTLTSATAANFAVLNPLDKNSNITVSGGNLNAISDATTNWRSGAMTFGNFTTGKWYYEVTANSIGAATYISAGWELTSFNHTTQTSGVGAASGNNFGVLINTALRQTKVNAAGFSSDVNVNANGDVLMIAVDFDAGKGWVGKNGTWYDSGNPSAGTNPCTTTVSGGMTPAYQAYNAGSLSFNAGQRAFSYTPPTGFVALNTYNLPDSTILKGNTVMDATLYTGNGSTNAITNAAGFKPDFVWGKSRSLAQQHLLFDSVRGVGNYLQSQSTAAEGFDANTLTSFNSNGFTLGSNITINTNASTNVAWQWQAGQGTTSTNTSGTITSTVSVNASAGFSVVTFTAPNASAPQTFGHGLGVAPAFFTIKARNTTSSWQTYHTSIGATNRLLLNTSDAQTTTSGPWNNTAPTSTVITIGSSFVPDAGATTYVAYCWTPIAGYSAFGSWQNNNSTDGTFVYLGFSPAVIILKNSDNAEQWYFRDIARQTYNVNPPSNIWLQPNTSNTEAANGATTAEIDVLSNGFKIRTTNPAAGEISYGTRTYIYGAWAANPFKNSLAR